MCCGVAWPELAAGSSPGPGPSTAGCAALYFVVVGRDSVRYTNRVSFLIPILAR